MTTGVILAGESKRFKEKCGLHKGLYKIDGLPLVVRIYRRLKGIFSKVILVTPEPLIFQNLKIPLREDIIKGKGPLGGLYTALLEFERVFLVGCDMPYPSLPLIRYMLSLPPHEVVACRVKGIIQPFFASYSSSLLPRIERNLKEGKLSLKEIIKGDVLIVEEKKVKEYDPELSSFHNLNIP